MSPQKHSSNQYEANLTPVTAFIQWLVQTHHLPGDPHLLDIGCGDGRRLVEYERLGWTSTGLEADADLYQRAVKTAATLHSASVFRGGFEQLNVQNYFDFITAVNDPFSNLFGVSERVEALQRMYHALRPGGVMFLELAHQLSRRFHYEPYTEKAAFASGKQVYFIKQQGFVDIQTYSNYSPRMSQVPSRNVMLISARKPCLFAPLRDEHESRGWKVICVNL